MKTYTTEEIYESIQKCIFKPNGKNIELGEFTYIPRINTIKTNIDNLTMDFSNLDRNIINPICVNIYREKYGSYNVMRDEECIVVKGVPNNCCVISENIPCLIECDKKIIIYSKALCSFKRQERIYNFDIATLTCENIWLCFQRNLVLYYNKKKKKIDYDYDYDF